MSAPADPQWRRHVGPGLRLVVTEPFEAGALALGLARAESANAALDRARRLPGGRGSNRLLESPLWPTGVRLRPARRGGWLARWLGDRHLSRRRPERELALWLALADRGASLPEPVLALSRRRGLFWHHAFAAVEIPGALDGEAWLARPRPPGDLEPDLTLLARTLRRFHDVGGLHGDLHLRNILFEGRGPATRCWLVDLDRARRREPVGPRARMRDIARLARSLEKTGHPELLDPRVCARFLAGYCAGDRPLRRALSAASPAESRRLRRHRLGWRISRWVHGAAVALLAAAGLACSPDPGSPAHAAPSPAPARLSLLAVGDTGRERSRPGLFEGQLVVARAMAEEDARAPVDALVLLGDNFYWHGLDRTHLVERLRENLVDPYCRFVRLTGPRSDAVRDVCPESPDERHPIPILAVLGNHDLERPESAALQREAIPAFVPNWQMSAGLAEVVELGQGVSLILFESEVAIRDRSAIRRALVDAVGRARGPWRILATHRPIATDDLGGVPVGGYPGFVRDALAEAPAPVQLVLAAHHHSLQAFELRAPTALLQVGLGSGSRAEPPLAHEDHPDVRFRALELGFGRVDLRGQGEDERLVVSLFAAPRWAWLAPWREPRLRARFEVDRAGRLTAATTDLSH